MGARRTGARSTVYGEKGTTRWTAATESRNAHHPLGLTPVCCRDDVHHRVSNLDSDPVVGSPLFLNFILSSITWKSCIVAVGPPSLLGSRNPISASDHWQFLGSCHISPTLRTRERYHASYYDDTTSILYFSIICAARCARSTSQNGSMVPIASVPTTAMPNAAHVIQPASVSWVSTCSTAAPVFALVAIRCS